MDNDDRGHPVTPRNSCADTCHLDMSLMVVRIIDQLGRVHLRGVNPLQQPAGKITADVIKLSKIVERGTEMKLISSQPVALLGRQPHLSV